MSFNQFCKENNFSKNDENYNSNNLNKEKVTNENQEKTENVKEFYDKYKSYSNQELMQELLKTTNEKKEKGEFDYNKLNESINALSPFLTNEQQNNIKGILEKLK